MAQGWVNCSPLINWSKWLQVFFHLVLWFDKYIFESRNMTLFLNMSSLIWFKICVRNNCHNWTWALRLLNRSFNNWSSQWEEHYRSTTLCGIQWMCIIAVLQRERAPCLLSHKYNRESTKQGCFSALEERDQKRTSLAELHEDPAVFKPDPHSANKGHFTSRAPPLQIKTSIHSVLPIAQPAAAFHLLPLWWSPCSTDWWWHKPSLLEKVLLERLWRLWSLRVHFGSTHGNAEPALATVQRLFFHLFSW